MIQAFCDSGVKEKNVLCIKLGKWGWRNLPVTMVSRKLPPFLGGNFFQKSSVLRGLKKREAMQ